MTLAQTIRSQSTQFSFRTPAGLWKWATRVDLTVARPQYQITDIVTPYGLLRDSVPLPGDVVAAMAQSIEEVKAVLTPTILVGPPSSLTFTVDEGRGFSPTQPVNVTNTGPYGSILGVTVTSGDPWVRPLPANIGPLATSVTGLTKVTVDSTDLLADLSPYTTTLTVQDSTATNNPVEVPVVVVVRPRATIAASRTVIDFVVSASDGSFAPVPSQQFLVQNVGPSGSVLDYEIRRVVGQSWWLKSFTPGSGILDAGSSEAVQITVQPKDGMLAGSYQETLRVSGYSSNYHVDVVVQLTII